MLRPPLHGSLPLLVSFALLGCAIGGGGEDAGGNGFDAGPTGVDSGPNGTDAGPISADGGPVLTDAGSIDAGPVGSDAGPDAGPVGTDAGPDAGPPPVDAGPLTPDAGGCSGTPCRVRPDQCGCGPTQGCYPITGGRACMTAGSTGEAGACTANTECQAGMLCVAGQCTRVCNDDSNCTGRGSLCQFTVNAGGETFNVCSVPCEPATGTGCLAGFACRHFDAGSGRGFYTDCVTEGSTAPGQDCSSNDECTRNHTCVNILGESLCREICRLDTGGDCFLCSGYVNQSPMIDGENYGFCI